MVQSIVDELKSGNGNVMDYQRISEFIHRFSVIMFTTDTTSLCQPIETVLEQALVAQMLTTNGWLSANRLINVLRALEYVCRSMLVNSAFMGSFDAPYKPINITTTGDKVVYGGGEKGKDVQHDESDDDIEDDGRAAR